MPNVAADGAVRMSRVLRAPIATVFDALIRPELLQRWMCPTNYTIARVEADARPGGRFRLEMLKPDGTLHPASGTYTEVAAPNVVAFTWMWEMAQHSMSGLETNIRIELTAQGKDTTHLLMTHYGLPNDEERVNHNKGWTSVLDNLERLYPPRSEA